MPVRHVSCVIDYHYFRRDDLPRTSIGITIDLTSPSEIRNDLYAVNPQTRPQIEAHDEFTSPRIKREIVAALFASLLAEKL